MVARNLTTRITRRLQRGILDAIGDAGLRLFAPRFAGLGVIFTLHRVVPAGQPYLYPGFEAPADFLDRTLAYVLSRGWEAVSIDEASRRLERERHGRRFVCFTLDDGYEDNYTIARPIFQRYGVPFCVYITTGILNRNIFYWWGGLENLIMENDEVTAPVPGGGTRRFQTRTLAEKRAAYDTLDEICHIHDEAYFPALAEMFRCYGVDAGRALDRDAMTVAQARELARDPLATIGAHGVSHRRMSLLSGDELQAEMEGGRRELQDTLGVRVDHLAYPFGNRDACGYREFETARAAGYRTAVTTRRGNLFAEHRRYLHCLPRRGFPTAHPDFRRRLYGVESILRKEPRFVSE